MAGDWLKVEAVTPDKPEVHRIAEILGIDPDAVLGKLFRVWVWADQQTENGHAPSVTKTLLDRVTYVTGFTDAMLDVGWLQHSEIGLTFTNFERHNGKPAKTRALAYQRKKKQRSKVSRTERDKSVTRDRDREERKKETKKTDSFDFRSLELPFATKEFENAWADFASMRKEIRKPLTPTGAKGSLKKLSEMGEPRAVAALVHTTANQWQGIREPDREQLPLQQSAADKRVPTLDELAQMPDSAGRRVAS